MNKEYLIKLIKKEKDINWLLEENFKAFLNLNNQSVDYFMALKDKHLKNKILALLKNNKINTSENYKNLINNLYKIVNDKTLLMIIDILENKYFSKIDDTYKFLSLNIENYTIMNGIYIFKEIEKYDSLLKSIYLEDTIILLTKLQEKKTITNLSSHILITFIVYQIENNPKNTNTIFNILEDIYYQQDLYNLKVLTTNDIIRKSPKFEEILNKYKKYLHGDTENYVKFMNIFYDTNFNEYSKFTHNGKYFFELDEFLNTDDLEIRENVLKLATNQNFIKEETHLYHIALSKLSKMEYEGTRRAFVSLAINLSESKNKYRKKIVDLIPTNLESRKMENINLLATNKTLINSTNYIDILELIINTNINNEIIRRINKNIDNLNIENIYLGLNTINKLDKFSNYKDELLNERLLNNTYNKEIINLINNNLDSLRLETILSSLKVDYKENTMFVLNLLLNINEDILIPTKKLLEINDEFNNLPNFKDLITHITNKFSKYAIEDIVELLNSGVKPKYIMELTKIKDDGKLNNYLYILTNLYEYLNKEYITTEEMDEILNDILSNSKKSKFKYLFNLASLTSILNYSETIKIKTILYKNLAKNKYFKKDIKKILEEYVKNGLLGYTQINETLQTLYPYSTKEKIVDNRSTLLEEYRKLKSSSELETLLDSIIEPNEISINTLVKKVYKAKK